MRKAQGFTLVELLVVIAIIALLMAILMPALARVRMQAKAVVCTQQLKQWALVFRMYTGENDGYFMCCCSGGPWGDGGMGYWWIECLRPYYKDDDLRLCSTATKAYDEGGKVPFGAWVADEQLRDLGSYGPNGWICNTPQSFDVVHGRPTAWNWRRSDVKGTANIPVFLDALWVDAWPLSVDEPAPYEWWLADIVGVNEMRRFCVNRHNSGVNVLFMDSSVRHVGLKSLWRLKWHRTYDTNGDLPNWPEWMANMPDPD